MKVNQLTFIRKNHKNSEFRSHVVELCRSGIFSEEQLLSQVKIARTSLRAWRRWYMCYRQGRWLKTKSPILMKKESDELLTLKQNLLLLKRKTNDLN